MGNLHCSACCNGPEHRAAWLCAALCLAATLAPSSSQEATVLVRAPLAAPATCGDGSPAALYFSPPPGGREAEDGAIWHLHLEDGATCYDEVTCKHAASSSSSAAPERLHVGGIFSRGPRATPLLRGAAHALLRDCSADAWLGNATATWQDGRRRHFRGSVILRAALDALLQRGMSSADLVVLSGCGTGGRGTLYNLDGVCEIVRSQAPGALCAGVSEAGWWVDAVAVPADEWYQENFGANVTVWESELRQEAVAAREVWGGDPDLAQSLTRCRARPPPRSEQLELREGAVLPIIHGVTPVNISVYDRCLFGPALISHVHSPVLLATALSDYVQLELLVRRFHKWYVGGAHGGPISRRDAEGARALRDSLSASLAASDKPAFASACYGHCAQLSDLYFSQRLRSGPGAGWSLNDTLATWLLNLTGRGDGNHSLPTRAMIEESQAGVLNCSVGCPPRRLWLLTAGLILTAILGPVVAVKMARLALLRWRKQMHGGDSPLIQPVNAAGAACD